MSVAQWLRNLGLDQYVAAFAANDIDLDLLAALTDADLKELGVASLGHRKRLLTAIAGLRSAPPAAASAVAATGSAVAEHAAGERRQVTILFADLCGFTTRSRSLDPEE